MKKNKMIYDVLDKPDLKTIILVALQHVFAMFASTILVPTLINEGAGYEVFSISTTLIASGIGTIIYLLITKGKSPGYLGSAFTYVTPLILGYLKAGIGGIFAGILAIGIIYVIVSFIIKLFSKKWIFKLFPPLVTGSMVIIIGLSLMLNSITNIGITLDGIVNYDVLLVALSTLIISSLFSLFGKGIFKSSPFIFGILFGCIIAYLYGMFNIDNINSVSLFVLPTFELPYIDYTFNLEALIYLIPLVIVTIPEHIGTHSALGGIINKDLIKDPGVDKTLLGNGLANIFSSFIGGPVLSIYGENTSVVGISKVASTITLFIASLIVIFIAFLGPLLYLMESIPSAVLNGVGLLLYGYIAFNGYRILNTNNVKLTKFKNIFIIIIMLLVGLGGSTYIFNLLDIPLYVSDMGIAALVGIVLNIIIPNKK